MCVFYFVLYYLISFVIIFDFYFEIVNLHPLLAFHFQYLFINIEKQKKKGIHQFDRSHRTENEKRKMGTI